MSFSEHRDATDRMLSSQEQQDMFDAKNNESFSNEFLAELKNNPSFQAEFLADMAKYAADVLLWRQASGITVDVDHIKTTDPIWKAYYILQSKYATLPDLLNGDEKTLTEIEKMSPFYQPSDPEIIAGAQEWSEIQQQNKQALKQLKHDVEQTSDGGAEPVVIENNSQPIQVINTKLDQSKEIQQPLRLAAVLDSDVSFESFVTALESEDPENMSPRLVEFIGSINQTIVDPDMHLASIKYVDGVFVFCTNGTCNSQPFLTRELFSSYITTLQIPPRRSVSSINTLTTSASYEDDLSLGSAIPYKGLSVHDRSDKYQKREDLLAYLPSDCLLLFGSDDCSGCTTLANKINLTDPSVPIIYIDTSINNYHWGNALVSEGYLGIPFLGINKSSELTPYQATDIHYSRASIDETLRSSQTVA